MEDNLKAFSFEVKREITMALGELDYVECYCHKLKEKLTDLLAEATRIDQKETNNLTK